jgi:hypothetical protein
MVEMKARDTKPVAVIAGSLLVAGGAIAAAVFQQGHSDSNSLAGSEMQTGVTITASTAPSAPAVPNAVPSIKGPAPLPPEEQGLPG